MLVGVYWREGAYLRGGLNRGFAVCLTKVCTACSNLVPRFLSYLPPFLALVFLFVNPITTQQFNKYTRDQ